MASTRARRWRTAGYVVPLVVVIAAALTWSSYATYHHALGPNEADPSVPHFVAWTMFVVLDGTVAVTTPVVLSTVLSRRVRTWAAVICAGALAWSMYINQAETGWMGVAPPLIAGALIHLVGLVLRDFRRSDRGESASTAKSDAVTSGPVVASAEVEHLMPTADPVEAEPEKTVSAAPPAQPSSDPVELPKGLPAGLPPQEIVFWLLNEAHAKSWPEPKGPELTAAVRAAGHNVNENYGRTTKARWMKAREEVRTA